MSFVWGKYRRGKPSKDWITWWYIKYKNSDSYCIQEIEPDLKDEEIIKEFKAPPRDKMVLKRQRKY